MSTIRPAAAIATALILVAAAVPAAFAAQPDRTDTAAPPAAAPTPAPRPYGW